LQIGTRPATARLASSEPAASAKAVNHWPFLDLIRFGAALLVLFGHSRGLLFEGIARVEHPNVFLRGFYLISGLQHEGVILFFVVSGFLVGGPVWRFTKENRFEFGTYFINRFARIYLVYIPALVFVLAITVAGQHFFGDTRFYAQRPLDPTGVFDGWTFDQIPCHLATLQGVFCIPWGADPPMWSLGYEWAFYLIAPPLFALALRPKQYGVIGFVVAAAALATLTWWNSEWLLWFSIWLLGVLAGRIFETKEIDIRIGLAGLAVCGGALVLSRLNIVPLIVTDLTAGIGIATAVCCRGLMKIGSGIRPISRGAAFSYSLYLIHLPTGIFVGALYERFAGWPSRLAQPDLKGLLGYAMMVIMALCVANLFARCTEDHTAAFREKLLSLRSSIAR
jgi:peptidoglycan/LPS O-acetylase OafA/YrhL